MFKEALHVGCGEVTGSGTLREQPVVDLEFPVVYWLHLGQGSREAVSCGYTIRLMSNYISTTNSY